MTDDESLSGKIKGVMPDLDSYTGYIWTKDVKEFVKKLKEEFFKKHRWIDHDLIDKIFGSKLI